MQHIWGRGGAGGLLAWEEVSRGPGEGASACSPQTKAVSYKEGKRQVSCASSRREVLLPQRFSGTWLGHVGALF